MPTLEAGPGPQPVVAGSFVMSHQVEVIVLQRPPFVDERGEILNLIDAPFGSALVVKSVRGAIRGNHYHKTDYHYSWLQSGGLIYAHRPLGDSSPPKRWRITPGQIFYTPPMYEHVMVFTADSVMLAFARNNRETANYEADTVRIPPIIDVGSLA